jgi:hypothetical protein
MNLLIITYKLIKLTKYFKGYHRLYWLRIFISARLVVLFTMVSAIVNGAFFFAHKRVNLV